MRLLFYTFVFLNLVSCNKEDAWECIQTSGTIISQEIEIDPFDRILVNRDIELGIKQGLEYKVKNSNRTKFARCYRSRCR